MNYTRSRLVKSLHLSCIGLIVLLLTHSTNLFSQDSLTTLKVNQLNNNIRIGFIPVKMPTDKFTHLKPTMGTASLHYQASINNWLYGGAAMYAAITGDQGGLFTLGVEVGINKKVSKHISLNSSFHFGGGGGYRSLVNHGGFINPAVGLGYTTDKFSFGTQYNFINFYSGSIKSNSIGFFISIPTTMCIASYQNAHTNYTVKGLENTSFRNKAGKHNKQQARFDFLFPVGDSRKDNGEELNNTLYTIGFEYQQYSNEKLFFYAHTDAIYKGLRAGFMDLFVGIGYVPIKTNGLDVITKVGVGAAGGRIAPEGGATIYPSLGLDWQLSNKLSLNIHSGYYRALAGKLAAYTAGFGIQFNNFTGGVMSESSKENITYKTQGITVSTENQTYFSVNKTDDLEDILVADLNLLALGVHFELSPNAYLLGEAGFAYGGRSGGYAHGIVGLGLQTNRLINERLNGFVTIGTGAAGGAGVDTGEGVIVRPTAGINIYLSKGIAITSSIGRLIAAFGNVNATNINIGLNLNFASLMVKH